MKHRDPSCESTLLEGKDQQLLHKGEDLQFLHQPTRRDFIRCSASAAGLLCLSSFNVGCGGSDAQAIRYPISSTVVKTSTRVISFPMFNKITVPDTGQGLCPGELCKVSQYGKYGYGNYTYSTNGLEVVPRYDIMPAGYAGRSSHLKKLANFFTFSDIHITDKETPNQLITIQQVDSTYGAHMTSIYSPVMLYSTQVLDAAVQTINALHEKNPFDFGISLGDAINSAQYNELRWYIDVLDGKLLSPSSGAHLGDATIDYQKPFKAAGLNPDIPWYQTLGNHDHFYIGSIPVDADPSLSIRESYLSSNVWKIGDVLLPNSARTFPCLFDTTASVKEGTYYGGVINGGTPNGDIIGSGPVSGGTQPVVVADKNRRALLRSELIAEFFNTASSPAGHGFNHVDKSKGDGFACYSFMPKSDIPLKVIVLDNTQSEDDGSHDIHGHGYLDATRWAWLQNELDEGQANNQLMIIAAHIPIAVAAIGSELEWWDPTRDPNAMVSNAVTLPNLVARLQSTPNLLMWLAGHRHFNTVKAFMPPATGGTPEMGFWQVETSSLRDFPQQFRTFEIYVNDDYTISIVTTNVDPAVAEGSPAEISRKYSIAAQQIVQNDFVVNEPNVQKLYGMSVSPLDPSRPQDGSADPSIEYGVVSGVPYCPSYNAELYKQLSPPMVAALKQRFPASQEEASAV